MNKIPIKRVVALYFSPTNTTKRVVEAIAMGGLKSLKERCPVESQMIAYTQTNITTPAQRIDTPHFEEGDLVVFGVPVYIGRVPNLMRDFIASIKGDGAIGIPIVVYGQRAYDDALLELRDIMVSNGFKIAAGGAFIGEHSFSLTLGGGRPDIEDISIAGEFGEKVIGKILSGEELPDKLEVPGNYPYKFFNAQSSNNKSIDIRKVKPQTDGAKCNGCGICATLCPMGSISPDNFSEVTGICIKCGACIKLCPNGAKSITDPTYLEHKEILERNFTSPRKEPELFW